MHNVQTGFSCTYHMLETEVNISLHDAVLSARQLRRGNPEPKNVSVLLVVERRNISNDQ